MCEKQKDRLLAIFKAWRWVGDIEVEIRSDCRIRGKFINAAGRNKIQIYLSEKKRYQLDLSKVVSMEFTELGDIRICVKLHTTAGEDIEIIPVTAGQTIK